MYSSIKDRINTSPSETEINATSVTSPSYTVTPIYSLSPPVISWCHASAPGFQLLEALNIEFLPQVVNRGQSPHSSKIAPETYQLYATCISRRQAPLTAQEAHTWGTLTHTEGRQTQRGDRLGGCIVIAKYVSILSCRCMVSLLSVLTVVTVAYILLNNRCNSNV